MQMTVRNIPAHTRNALEKLAKAEGKSLNDALLEAIDRGLAIDQTPRVYDDLDWFLGTGGLKKSVLKAIREHDVVHPDDL